MEREEKRGRDRVTLFVLNLHNCVLQHFAVFCLYPTVLNIPHGISNQKSQTILHDFKHTYRSMQTGTGGSCHYYQKDYSS